LHYVRESSDDRKVHRIRHDKVVNGVPVPPAKSEKVIWSDGGDRIVVVTPLSPKTQRVRAEKVAWAANREMHYDFGIYHESELPDSRNLHLFIYCRGSRAVGLAILERRNHICHYTWEEFDRREQKRLEKAAPIWSLGFAWVHRNYRSMRIARTLFDQATRFFGVGPENVGVYTPFSDEGKRFARSLFPLGFIIAK
jgi:hypothetical protein